MNIGTLWAQIGLDNSQLKSSAKESEQVISGMGDNIVDSIKSTVIAGAAAFGMGLGLHKIIQEAREAIQAIDALKLATIQIAAQITTMQGPKDVAQHYADATKYADGLNRKLMEIDAYTFANFQTLQSMTQVMAMQGVILDYNNKKQIESFTALSNAVAMYTAGQNQSLQARQETNALLTGHVNMNSRLAQQMDGLIKAEGIYRGGLKEVVKLGKQHGDLLERFTPYLVGINAASGDIANTWEAVTSSAQTAKFMIQSVGFKDLYKDAIDVGLVFVNSLKANQQEYQIILQELYRATKEVITGVISAFEELNKLHIALGGSEFPSVIEGFKSAIFSVEAEIIRLAMLLDKAGGSATTLAWALAGGNFTESGKWWAEQNKMYEDRHKNSDIELNDLAMREQGFRKLTKEQEALYNQMSDFEKSRSTAMPQEGYGIYTKDIAQVGAAEVPVIPTAPDQDAIEQRKNFIDKINLEAMKSERKGMDDALVLALEYNDKMTEAAKYGEEAKQAVKRWYFAEAALLDSKQAEESIKEAEKATKESMKIYKDSLDAKLSAEKSARENQPIASEAIRGYDSQLSALESAQGTKEQFREMDIIRTQEVQNQISSIEAAAARERIINDAQTNKLRVRAAQDSAAAMVNILQALFIASGSKSRELFEMMKVARIAQATVDTYAAATKALAEVPYPYSIAAAAAIVAGGLANVATIASTTIGGSGGGGGGGGTSIQTQDVGYKYFNYEQSEYGSGWRAGEGQGAGTVINVNGDVYAQDGDAFKAKVVGAWVDDYKDNGNTRSVAKRYA